MISGSSSVVLDNVDDYLTPSNACINPLFQPPPDNDEKEKEKAANNKKSSGVVVPQRRRRRVRRNVPGDDNSFTSLVKPTSSSPNQKTKSTAIKASIADCLACSGCVTTAETVLLEQRHSLDSLRQRLQTNKQNGRQQQRVITISPNSLADLCRHWQLTPSELYRPLTTLLNQILNASVVIDGNLPLQWTWLDEAREFVELFKIHRANNDDGTTNFPSKPMPSSAVDSERSITYPSGKIVENAKDVTPPHIPLISGSCPALVCLVEKSLSHLVPYLSQSQSPMSRMGSVLKQNVNNDALDHWAIMPCHDKKLEASRSDFVFPAPKRHAVDLVITTQELTKLIEEWIGQQYTKETHDSVPTVAAYLKSLAPAEELILPAFLKFPSTNLPTKPTFITTDKSATFPDDNHDDWDEEKHKQMAYSSGGHANFIFRYAAKHLFDCDLETIQWQPASLSNTVVKSARLARQQKQHSYRAQLYRQDDGSFSQVAVSSEPPVLSFGIAHGMQTMQRALKQLHVDTNNKKNSLQYLEAMACPFGCVNGGGAARTSDQKRETPTETRQRVGSTVRSLTVPIAPSESCLTQPRRTRYHVVPPMQHTMGATSGVKVDDILW